MKDNRLSSFCQVVISAMRRSSVAVVLGIVTIAISGCISIGPAHVWSKEQVVDWCAQWAVPRSSAHEFAIVYLGSDEKYDHFMARPIDYWVFIRTPRGEIDLLERFPRAKASSGPASGYRVIPSRNFERVDEEPNQALQTTPGTRSEI